MMALKLYEERLTGYFIRRPYDEDGDGGEVLTLEISRATDIGSVRIDSMELQMWQSPTELAEWLEWCAARIREVGE
jgi:hypothetical protein